MGGVHCVGGDVANFSAESALPILQQVGGFATVGTYAPRIGTSDVALSYMKAGISCLSFLCDSLSTVGRWFCGCLGILRPTCRVGAVADCGEDPVCWLRYG